MVENKINEEEAKNIVENIHVNLKNKDIIAKFIELKY
jgi:hypothetical protein